MITKEINKTTSVNYFFKLIHRQNEIIKKTRNASNSYLKILTDKKTRLNNHLNFINSK